MRIAFDGKKAARNRAGLGNYSRFVIGTMARRFPDCMFDIYISKDRTPSLLSSLEELPNVRICRPTHPVLKHFPFLWEMFGIPYELSKRETDIFHGLGNVLPRNIRKAVGVKSVVTIHDLIFVSYPDTYNWIDRHLYNIKFRRACRQADRIIAVSKCTARDIVKYYFTPKQKITVVYQGCDSSFRDNCPDSFKQEVRSRFNLPSRYILSVGTIEARKNTALIVKALEKLPQYNLVLVGKRTKYTALVEETAAVCGVADRVLILDNVGFKDLPAIYQMAELFVYPSRYEGFGIPMLEALCSGVPAVGATGSCLEEAGGEASMYVDPDNVGELVEKLQTLSVNKPLREEMIRKGHEYSDNFTDDMLADRLMDVYHELLGEEKH